MVRFVTADVNSSSPGETNDIDFSGVLKRNKINDKLIIFSF